jgi:hypothetical protein
MDGYEHGEIKICGCEEDCNCDPLSIVGDLVCEAITGHPVWIVERGIALDERYNRDHSGDLDWRARKARDGNGGVVYWF